MCQHLDCTIKRPGLKPLVQALRLRDRHPRPAMKGEKYRGFESWILKIGLRRKLRHLRLMVSLGRRTKSHGRFTKEMASKRGVIGPCYIPVVRPRRGCRELKPRPKSKPRMRSFLGVWWCGRGGAVGRVYELCAGLSFVRIVLRKIMRGRNDREAERTWRWRRRASACNELSCCGQGKLCWADAPEWLSVCGALIGVAAQHGLIGQQRRDYPRIGAEIPNRAWFQKKNMWQAFHKI